MKLTIHHKTISQLQEDFNNLFPYLRIQFFNKKQSENQNSSSDELIKNPNIVLILKNTNDEFEILGTMTVFELEHLFKTKYHLNIQVFRKSVNAWLETSVTDGWTLNKQNQEGFELSKY